MFRKYSDGEKKRLLEPYDATEISKLEAFLFDTESTKHFRFQVLGVSLMYCKVVRNDVGFVAVIRLARHLSDGNDHTSPGSPEDPVVVFNEVAFPHVVATLRDRGRTVNTTDFDDWKDAVLGGSG